MLLEIFPTFRRVLEALRIEWRNSTPCFASVPERRNENINLSKYFIECVLYPQPVGFTVTLCATYICYDMYIILNKTVVGSKTESF